MAQKLLYSIYGSMIPGRWNSILFLIWRYNYHLIFRCIFLAFAILYIFFIFLQLECSYTLYGNQIISHTKERKKERTNAKTTVIERTENDLNLQKQKSPNVLK